MKAMTLLVTLFILFVQPVIGTAGGGQDKPLPGIAGTYADVKTIRVVVEQSYGVKHNVFVVLYKVTLPFFEVSKEVLEGYGGIQVFADDGPEPVDAVLLIKAKGKAIGPRTWGQVLN